MENLGRGRDLVRNVNISSIMGWLAKPRLMMAWKKGSMARQLEELPESQICLNRLKQTS